MYSYREVPFLVLECYSILFGYLFITRLALMGHSQWIDSLSAVLGKYKGLSARRWQDIFVIYVYISLKITRIHHIFHLDSSDMIPKP
ncbi:hypothetical protein WAI453_005393 [Rhynchosporium graminicola]